MADQAPRHVWCRNILPVQCDRLEPVRACSGPVSIMPRTPATRRRSGPQRGRFAGRCRRRTARGVTGNSGRMPGLSSAVRVTVVRSPRRVRHQRHAVRVGHVGAVRGSSGKAPAQCHRLKERPEGANEGATSARPAPTELSTVPARPTSAMLPIHRPVRAVTRTVAPFEDGVDEDTYTGK